MGGKTQQRIAGGVKPSSSGRIRDLLINKHGAGNIITFKTLSNNPPREQVDSPSNQINEKAINSDLKRLPQTSPIHSILSTNDRAALLVRKVGNRECFTRVRFSDETKNFQNSSQEPVVQAGENLANLQLDEASSAVTYKSEEEKANQSSEMLEQTLSETEETSEKQEILDFDTILGILRDKVPMKIQSSTTLNDTTFDEISESIRLMKMMITYHKQEISIEEWDVVNESLHNWIELTYHDQNMLGRSEIQTKFFAQVLSFLSWLLDLGRIYNNPEKNRADFPIIENLIEDWKNFYSSSMCRKLLVLHFRLVPSIESTSDISRIFEALATVVLDSDANLVINDNEIIGLLNPKIEFDSDIELPEGSKFSDIDYTKYKGFNEIVNLLKSNHRGVVVAAHSIMRKLIDSISSTSATITTVDENNDIESMTLLPPQALMATLTSRDSIVTALLSDYRVGDISVTLDPGSDSYTCTLSYLFTWDIVIRFITGQDKEAAHLMIHCLKRLGLFQRLLDTIFMLLPPLGERDSLKFQFESEENVSRDQPERLSNFLRSPLKTTAFRQENEIELTALHVYFSMALHMPVTVRKWYNNNSSKRLTNLVNEYTVKHISQIICSLEMETVQEKCLERELDHDPEYKLIVKARPTAKEVYALYTRDEFKMELTVKLPINYPLGPVQIDGGKRVGVTDQKWRSWLLQLTTFLSHQNGSILDGIDLWRRNIDKKFEGIEKCLICFSILHSNYQLPKKKCSTCTKMFHNLCLYKWFETSGNSTCPLCRNTW